VLPVTSKKRAQDTEWTGGPTGRGTKKGREDGARKGTGRDEKGKGKKRSGWET